MITMKKLKNFSEALKYKYLLIWDDKRIVYLVEFVQNGRINEGNSNHIKESQYKLYEVKVLIQNNNKPELDWPRYIDDRCFDKNIYPQHGDCSFNGLNDLNELPLMAQFVLMS